MKSLARRALGPCTLLAASLCAACEGRPRHHDAPPTASPPSTLPSITFPSSFPAASGSASIGSVRIPTFADLVQKANPAVVFIETEQAVYGRGRRIVSGGVGSGFVFDPNGLILTNHHVVASATHIEAVFGEEDRKRATIVGVDPPTDIAVLRVEARDLAHLPLGDSDQSRVGDWVVAIGNPFSLSHTVSAGILSARGRTRNDVKGLDPSGYYDYLQTDASINPGNSGGPLLDLAGRVIGINTAIKPEANSIGFAIPINMIRELLPQIIAHGHVRRSAMGVAVASVKEEDVTRLKLPNRVGSLVTRVTRGGPGDRAGLRVDDVITGFDGTSGPGPNRLRWLTSVSGVGKSVRVKVRRDAREQELMVELGELQTAPEEAASASP